MHLELECQAHEAGNRRTACLKSDLQDQLLKQWESHRHGKWCVMQLFNQSLNVAQDLVVEQRLRCKFPILLSAQRLDLLQMEEESAKHMQKPSDCPPDFTRAFRAFFGVSALFTDELFDRFTRYFDSFQGTNEGKLALSFYEEIKSAFPTLGPGDHYQLVKCFAEITGFPRIHCWDPRPACEINN